MQEEEAALLTIGAVLEWRAARHDEPFGIGGVWDMARFDTGEGYGHYHVQLKPDDSPIVRVEAMYFFSNIHMDAERTLSGKGGMPSYYWYNTVAEAKSAWEIHAATGQFPPGVEPELLGVEQSREERRNQ